MFEFLICLATACAASFVKLMDDICQDIDNADNDKNNK